MSDVANAIPGWITALDRRTARFVSDSRFGEVLETAETVEPQTSGDAPQPSQDVWQEGYAAGFAAAAAELTAQADQDGAARAGLKLAFARLDEAARRELAERLVETVAQLCEATLEPLALDHAALQRRCEAAANLLGEAPERMTLHVSPDDLPMLDPAFRQGLTIIADDSLPRGTIQLDGPGGGITDGPPAWSARLREALAVC